MDVLPQPLYYFFLCNGIVSFKYLSLGDGKKTLLFCSKHYLWVVLMFLYQIFGTLFYKGLQSKPLFSEHPIDPKHKQNILCRTVVSLISNIVTTVNFVSCSKHSSKLLKVYNSLEKFNKNTNKTCKHTTTYIHIFVSMFPMLILFIIINFFFPKQYGSFFINIPFLIQQSALIAVNIQYCHICHMLTQSFNAINEEIEQEISLLSYEMLLKDFQGPLSAFKFVEGGRGSVGKVKALMNLYWTLCETVQEANVFYSTMLFARSCFSFVDITIRLYQVFTLILYNADLYNLIDVMMELYGFATHVFQLILMVWASTKVTNGAEETAPMVSKLFNRHLNPEMKRQMELFLLQLLHHNARFSALGFFYITTQILTAIAGSVTTYLFILIQFQAAD